MAFLEKEKELKLFMEKQMPLWEPGTGVGYSQYVVGFYLNEICKMCDKKGRK